MSKELNENDRKLLEFCKEERTISEIARHLKIAPKNVSVRIPYLRENKKINVVDLGLGKPTYIRTSPDTAEQIKKDILSLLQKIKGEGGLDIKEILPKEELSALVHLRFQNPPLIKEKIFLTEEGQQFLKEHSKTQDKK